MSILDSLITDRTSADASRLNALSLRGWQNLSADERGEWLYGKAEPLYCIDGRLTCLDGELNARSGTNKGAYNSSDLNRVEEATAYIAAELNTLLSELIEITERLGVSWESEWLPNDPAVGELVTKTDWASEIIPDSAELERYLRNVRALNTLNIPISLPASMERFSFASANNIERLLILIDEKTAELKVIAADRAERISKAWFYSGDIYGGEI